MPSRRSREKWAFVAVSVLLCAGAAFVLFSARQQYLANTASVPSQCEILALGVRAPSDTGGSGKRSRATVSLAHEVDGVRYVADDEGPGHQVSSDAIAQSARLGQVGSKVPCKYVAGHPQIVRVFDDAKPWWALAGFGVFLLCMPFGIYVLDKRRRR